VNDESKLDFEKQVIEILDLIRPALQIDGGDVKLVAIDGPNVKVKLSGPYIDGPHVATLIKMGIERTLRDKLPNMGKVLLDNT
jgi:Fe-S cluster biogenesis protein NfuA